MRDRLTIVFARSPEEERRAKPLGAADRATEGLHHVLLARTLQAAEAGGGDVRWVAAGDLDRARALAEQYVDASHLQLASQVGNSLGEKLTTAIADAFADGYRRVLVVGGDTPGLSSAELAAAFASLASDARRAVLGPAPDGGFYLLGMSAPIGALLNGVALCTAKAASDTRAALEAAGFSLTCLRPLADIDDRHDLILLRKRLCSVRRSDRLLLSATDAVLSVRRQIASSTRRVHSVGVRRANAARAPPLAL